MGVITQFNENMEIIAALPNQPALSAQELKEAFDKSGVLIKQYLNETVFPALQALEEAKVDVVNSLDSQDISAALSAAQGAYLQNAKQDKIEGLTDETLGYLVGLTGPITTQLASKQSKITYGETLPETLGEGDVFLLI